MTFFNHQHMLTVHIIQIMLVHVVIGLSIPRLFMKNQPRTRASTIALAMSAKSLIVISYQVLTGHVHYFQRWRSLKANAILNGLEVVFWAAVPVLLIQANIKRCSGVSCTLSWIVVGLGIVLSIIAMWTATVSYLEFRTSRWADVSKGSATAKDDAWSILWCYRSFLEDTYVGKAVPTSKKSIVSNREGIMRA